MARQKKSAPKRKTRPATYRPEREPVVPHFIRTQIKELLSGYPSGLLGSMFALAFHRRFGQELSYEKLRFKSLGHLLESMSDVVRIEDMRGGGYRVYGKTNDKVNLGMLNSVSESVSNYMLTMPFALSRLTNLCLQLFRERLSEKVHATIPKGIVGGFKFTVLQRSLKE